MAAGVAGLGQRLEAAEHDGEAGGGGDGLARDAVAAEAGRDDPHAAGVLAEDVDAQVESMPSDQVNRIRRGRVTSRTVTHSREPAAMNSQATTVPVAGGPLA